jgi:hypothetical protein
MDSRDAAHSVNGEFPGDESLPLSAERWAEIFGIESKRVAELFRERNVPRKQIGRRIWACARDVWSRFDWIDGSE